MHELDRQLDFIKLVLGKRFDQAGEVAFQCEHDGKEATATVFYGDEKKTIASYTWKDENFELVFRTIVLRVSEDKRDKTK